MLDLQLSTPWSVRNTSFRSADGSVQYYVETPHSWGKRSSKVSRWRGASREIVATIDWNIVDLPKVRFAHQVIDGDNFLKRGQYNKYSYHIMTVPCGDQYEWKSNLTPELFALKPEGLENKEKKTLAIYKHANWLKGRRPRLLVDESVLDILDQIVVSFIVVENMRMERSH